MKLVTYKVDKDTDSSAITKLIKSQISWAFYQKTHGWWEVN